MNILHNIVEAVGYIVVAVIVKIEKKKKPHTQIQET